MDGVRLIKNLQYLGIYGIIEESCKLILIHEWRKIFSHITLVFILPLSLLLFANMETSNFVIQKITHHQLILQHTQKFTPEFHELSDLVSSERIYYVLFNFGYVIFSTVFSLLATSAAVYTVACIYAAREVSFKHVITAVPKIWKRLLVTFLCVLAAFFAFNFVAFSVVFLIPVIAVLIYGPNDHNFGAGIGTILFFFIIFYCVGVSYLMIIWKLSSVVTVLEDFCGFKAMAKSKALVQGKIWMVTKLFMFLNLPLGVPQFVLYYVVVRPAMVGVVGRGVLEIISISSFLLFFSVKLVAETVLYFVCKSHHRESVDNLALSNHLKVICQLNMFH